MLRTITTDRTVDEVGAALEADAQEFGLSVLNVHDLAARMAAKGHPFATPVRVYDVCSAPSAHKVLSVRLDVAAALPCRIAVYEKDGRTTLSTLRPTILLALFQEESLESVAADVEKAILGLMDHVARG